MTRLRSRHVPPRLIFKRGRYFNCGVHMFVVHGLAGRESKWAVGRIFNGACRFSEPILATAIIAKCDRACVLVAEEGSFLLKKKPSTYSKFLLCDRLLLISPPPWFAEFSLLVSPCCCSYIRNSLFSFADFRDGGPYSIRFPASLLVISSLNLTFRCLLLSFRVAYILYLLVI